MFRRRLRRIRIQHQVHMYHALVLEHGGLDRKSEEDRTVFRSGPVEGAFRLTALHPKSRSHINSTYFISLVYLVLLMTGDVVLPCVANATTRSGDREALMALYVATNGPAWISNTSWTSGDPCTDAWYGVACDAAGPEHVVTYVSVFLIAANLVLVCPHNCALGFAMTQRIKS